MHNSAGKAALWIPVNGRGQGDRKTLAGRGLSEVT